MQNRLKINKSEYACRLRLGQKQMCCKALALCCWLHLFWFCLCVGFSSVIFISLIYCRVGLLGWVLTRLYVLIFQTKRTNLDRLVWFLFYLFVLRYLYFINHRMYVSHQSIKVIVGNCSKKMRTKVKGQLSEARY